MSQETFNRGRVPAFERRRRKIEAGNTECFWCRQEMLLVKPWVGKSMPFNGATLEHLYPRGHPRRGERGSVKLSHYRCNNTFQTISDLVRKGKTITGDKVVKYRKGGYVGIGGEKAHIKMCNWAHREWKK